MKPWAGLFVAALASVGLSLAATPASADSFYDATAAEIEAGPPGSIIRFLGIDNSQMTEAKAYRVLYRSVAPDGRRIAVSGMIVAPFRTPPAGGWPVVAWAHPTTGIARDCAPTIMWPDPVAAVPGINEMLERDYVVAATDYPGLGGPGVHPYMVGVSEGRAVLDIVRAARELSVARGSDRYVLWGHSQGGQAALWAGQLSASYAPELKLLGVALAAPATELGKLFEDDLNTLAGRMLSGLVLESWSKYYGFPLTGVVEAEDIPTIAKIGRNCIDLLGGELRDLEANRALPNKFLSHNPVTTEPWQSRIAENIPNPARAVRVPYFVAQGTADTVVDPPVTIAYVRHMCGLGLTVDFVELPGVNHTKAAMASGSQAVEWMAGRFAKRPAPNRCPR